MRMHLLGVVVCTAMNVHASCLLQYMLHDSIVCCMCIYMYVYSLFGEYTSWLYMYTVTLVSCNKVSMLTIWVPFHSSHFSSSQV